MADYTHEELSAVWAKGKAVPPNSPDQFRQDVCGAWMEWKQYGNQDSERGWQVDHIDPNGPHQISNWQPLQWKNNQSKSDGKLTCPIIASGGNNIDRSK